MAETDISVYLRGLKNTGKLFIDSLVKSRISPPLVGGDKGEGDITRWNSGVITLTPTLSHQGRGSFWTFYECIKVGLASNMLISMYGR